jgi:hypothetical protein
MPVQIRRAVFETNSSSSHSLTIAPWAVVPPPVPREAARAGVLALSKGSYQWEWKRYYTPQNKLRYLFTQALREENVPDGPPEQVRARLFRRHPEIRRLFEVFERYTGVRVVPEPGFADGIDYQSRNVGSDLLDSGSRNRLARFLFDPDSYVETGNDNSPPPRYIDDDLGRRQFYYGADALAESVPEDFVPVQLYYPDALCNKADATTRSGRSFAQDGPASVSLLWRMYHKGIVTEIAYYHTSRWLSDDPHQHDYALFDILRSPFTVGHGYRSCTYYPRARVLEQLRVSVTVDTTQQHSGVILTLAVPAPEADEMARFEAGA